MKKIIYSAVALLMTAFTFTSCEDVPMPYEWPNINPGQGTVEGVYINETFATTTGSFTVQTTKGTPWTIDFNTAKASGYDNSTKVTTESESYLVSKEIDLSKSEGAYIQFEYIYRYGSKADGPAKLYITSEYTGDATTTKWTDITGKLIEGADWTTFSTYAENVPAEFIGKDKVVIAFYYSCKTNSITWEVKNLVMQEGKAPDAGTDEPGTGSGEEPTPGEAKGSGTKDDPYNTYAMIQKLTGMSADATTEELYVSGKIVSIKEVDTGTYGNATYYISDDGTENNQLYIFRSLDLGNKKFTSKDAIKVGDEVVICGQFMNYMGNTPETVANKSYLYSVNGNNSGGNTGGDDPTPGEGSGTGTKADPYNVAAVQSLFAAGTPDANKEYYVEGTVSEVVKFNDQYGSINYYISDNGTSANQFYIYSGIGLNKEKFTSIDGLKVGDKVVVCGKFTTYNGTPQFNYNNYLVSLNGQGGDTGGDEPTPGTSDAVSIDGTTLTLTNTTVTAGTETATIDLNSLGLSNADPVTGPYAFSDGATMTLAMGEGTTTPAYYEKTKGFRIYAKNTITFDGKKKIAKIVFECDAYNGTNYTGNPTATVQFTDNGAVYCNDHTEAKGGVQLRAQKITITYAQ